MRKLKALRSRRTASEKRSNAGAVQPSRAKSGIKVIQIGTSMGAIFPKEMLAQLKVQKGDTLFTIETPDGVLLTPYDPEIERQLAAGREFMREYRDTFRALAK
jgi:putative addiction module antidote